MSQLPVSCEIRGHRPRVTLRVGTASWWFTLSGARVRIAQLERGIASGHARVSMDLADGRVLHVAPEEARVMVGMMQTAMVYAMQEDEAVGN